MTPDEPKSLFEDPSLSITYLQGRGNQLVVCFTGIGLKMGGIQKVEFVGSATEGRENHVAFVTDRNRSWYSTPGMQNRIVNRLLGLIAAKKISRVITLGNSMGGHGALLFARRLGAQVAIAFSPQFSMDPKVVVEDRWPKSRASIKVGGLGNLSDEMSAHTRTHVFFGAEAGDDHVHCNHLVENGIPTVYMINGAEHDSAKLLKKAKALSPAISAMIADDRPGLMRCLGPLLAVTHPSKHGA